MIVNVEVTPVFHESTWNEDEESMSGLIYSFEGSHFCALRRTQSQMSSPRMRRRAAQGQTRELETSLAPTRHGNWADNTCRRGDKHFEETKEERWEDVREK